MLSHTHTTKHTLPHTKQSWHTQDNELEEKHVIPKIRTLI